MKNAWYIILLSLVSLTACKNRPLNPSCALENPAYDFYRDDAEGLALKLIIDEQLPQKDSIEISQADVERVLKALIAVYNVADVLPAANSVVHRNDIHPDPFESKVFVRIDTNYVWTREWMSGGTLTGNPEIDSLITTYDLTPRPLFKMVTLKSDKFLNTWALSDAFKKIDGIVSASPSYVSNRQNGIEIGYSGDSIHLKYNLGWGDCMSGCIYDHSWEFLVSQDCEVTLLSDYGNTPPAERTILHTSKVEGGEIPTLKLKRQRYEKHSIFCGIIVSYTKIKLSR